MAFASSVGCVNVAFTTVSLTRRGRVVDIMMWFQSFMFKLDQRYICWRTLMSHWSAHVLPPAGHTAGACHTTLIQLSRLPAPCTPLARPQYSCTRLDNHMDLAGLQPCHYSEWPAQVVSLYERAWVTRKTAVCYMFGWACSDILYVMFVKIKNILTYLFKKYD